jgi:hypothetical protein
MADRPVIPANRELGHQLDVARDLVPGDMALAEFADLLGRGGLAALQLDPGADLLAVARIGHSDHLVEPVAKS